MNQLIRSRVALVILVNQLIRFLCCFSDSCESVDSFS